MHLAIEVFKALAPTIIAILGGFCVGNDYGYKKALEDVKKLMEKGEIKR